MMSKQGNCRIRSGLLLLTLLLSDLSATVAFSTTAAPPEGDWRIDLPRDLAALDVLLSTQGRLGGVVSGPPVDTTGSSLGPLRPFAQQDQELATETAFSEKITVSLL